MMLIKIDKETREIPKDRFLFFFLIFSIILILSQVSMILISSGKLPPQLPLFYSRPWGEAILASSWALWILPVVSILGVLVNFLIAIFLVANNRFLCRILIIFALLVVLASVYDTVKIISLLT